MGVVEVDDELDKELAEEAKRSGGTKTKADVLRERMRSSAISPPGRKKETTLDRIMAMQERQAAGASGQSAAMNAITTAKAIKELGSSSDKERSGMGDIVDKMVEVMMIKSVFGDMNPRPQSSIDPVMLVLLMDRNKGGDGKDSMELVFQLEEKRIAQQEQFQQQQLTMLREEKERVYVEERLRGVNDRLEQLYQLANERVGKVESGEETDVGEIERVRQTLSGVQEVKEQLESIGALNPSTEKHVQEVEKQQLAAKNTLETTIANKGISLVDKGISSIDRKLDTVIDLWMQDARAKGTSGPPIPPAPKAPMMTPPSQAQLESQYREAATESPSPPRRNSGAGYRGEDTIRAPTRPPAAPEEQAASPTAERMCSQCGGPINEGDTICPSCGAALQ